MAPRILLPSDFDGVSLRRLARSAKDAAQARRLLSLATIYDGSSRTDAAKVGSVTLQVVRDRVVRFNARGPAGLVNDKAPGNRPKLNDAQRQALARMVDSGPIPAIHGVVRWRRKDLVQWIFETFRICVDETTVGRELKALGAGLVLPWCDTDAMNRHLEEVAIAVDVGAHAVLILDGAGWHVTPNLVVPQTITPLFLPPRAPELNPVENVWKFMRDNWLSNRIFADYDDIISHCCDAWNKLVEQPWKVISLGMRQWVHAF